MLQRPTLLDGGVIYIETFEAREPVTQVSKKAVSSFVLAIVFPSGGS